MSDRQSKKVPTADPEVAEAEAALTDALRAAVGDIKSGLEKLSASEIRARVKLGRKVVAIKNDVSGQYGTDPVEAIYRVLPQSRDVLRPMVVAAERFSDDDVDRLCALHNPQTGEGLTWTHVWALTRVRADDKVMPLAERTVAEGWGTKSLVREVIRANGGRVSKGGRKAKALTSFAAALADIRAKVQTFRNAATQQWLAPGGVEDLYVELVADRPGKKPDPAVVGELDALEAELDGLGVQVKTLAATVGRVGLQAKAALRGRDRVA